MDDPTSQELQAVLKEYATGNDVAGSLAWAFLQAWPPPVDQGDQEGGTADG